MKLARVAHGGAVHLARIEGDAAVLLAAETVHPAADVPRGRSRPASTSTVTASGSPWPTPGCSPLW
jgi:hypothetical protein